MAALRIAFLLFAGFVVGFCVSRALWDSQFRRLRKKILREDFSTARKVSFAKGVDHGRALAATSVLTDQMLKTARERSPGANRVHPYCPHCLLPLYPEREHWQCLKCKYAELRTWPGPHFP